MTNTLTGSFRRILLAGVWSLVVTTAASAQTEFHLKYGPHRNPFSKEDVSTTILNVQQASFWRFGDSFYFFNYITDGKLDGFNDRDFYGEWYPTLSIGKLSNREVRFGPIRDIGIIAGINIGIDPKLLKYLPGLRFSWDLPGFIFLNTDLTAYIDRNAGVEEGGAPKTDHSFVFDVNWSRPFEIGNQAFSIHGHAEYIGSRTDELGQPVPGSILAQPQFVWDLGRAIVYGSGQIMIGIEYQYWSNKFGTDENESTVQLLLVWRL